MDAVTDLLQATRLSGGVFLDAEFTAPWCVRSGVTAAECRQFGIPAAHVIAYHYICEGRMLLELDGHEPVVADSGEIVLLPHNEQHLLGSASGLPPVDPAGLMMAGSGGALARIMGETPMRYLARQRLQLAAKRLEDPGSSIARIAFEVGYESEAAFNRAFKRAFGAPPAAWRDARQ